MQITPILSYDKKSYSFKRVENQAEKDNSRNNISSQSTAKKNYKALLASLLLTPLVLTQGCERDERDELYSNNYIQNVFSVESSQNQNSKYNFNGVANKEVQKYLESIKLQQEEEISELKKNIYFTNAEIPYNLYDYMRFNKRIKNPQDLLKFYRNDSIGIEKVKDIVNLYNKINEKTEFMQKINDNKKLLNSNLVTFADENKNLSPKELLDNFVESINSINEQKTLQVKMKQRYNDIISSNNLLFMSVVESVEYSKTMKEIQDKIDSDYDINSVDLSKINLLKGLSTSASDEEKQLQEIIAYNQKLRNMLNNISQRINQSNMKYKEIVDNSYKRGYKDGVNKGSSDTRSNDIGTVVALKLFGIL